MLEAMCSNWLRLVQPSVRIVPIQIYLEYSKVGDKIWFLLLDHNILLDYRGFTPTGSKLQYLFKKIQECKENNEKVVVFSFYTSYFNALKQQLETMGHSVSIIDKNTSKRYPFYHTTITWPCNQRAPQIIKTFSEKEGSAVLLVGTKSGGVGFNIQCATKLFLLDTVWNPEVWQHFTKTFKYIWQVIVQAYSRSYRYLQKNNVTFEILLMKETLDMHMFLKSFQRLELNNLIDDAAPFHPCHLGIKELKKSVWPY